MFSYMVGSGKTCSSILCNLSFHGDQSELIHVVVQSISILLGMHLLDIEAGK